MGEQGAGRPEAERADEPASYRAVLSRQVRGGLPALAALLLLFASQTYVYGAAALAGAGIAIVGGIAAFAGGLALRRNDRGFAAGCLLAAAAAIGVATRWVAAADSSGVHWALLAAFGWATLLFIAVGHASPDDP